MDSLRARIRDGDPAAFATLFDGNAGALHRYALRVTGNRATAEDVVSLTFLEAWRLRGRLRPDEPGDGRDGDGLRAWLFGIAANIVRNTTRSARRHRAALERLPPRADEPDFAEELADRAAQAEELAAAHRALRLLRRGEREVLALVVWSGLSHAEAAEALGCRVGTVKSRLSRARARLRSLAQDELRQMRGRPEPGGAAGQPEVDRTDTVRPSTETHGRTR
jgi:RNA polymerase sigma-70 factor (ECF subfamily)